MSTDTRIQRLEAELDKLRRSTRIALEESWEEVERLESENAYREEKILALQNQLAVYMHKETEEDLTRDSTSASSQSTSPNSPEGKRSISSASKNDDEVHSDQQIEINFPVPSSVRSLLSSTRQASLRSLVSIGGRQGSGRSIGSPMNSFRGGRRTCGIALSPIQGCTLGDKSFERLDVSENSQESFPIAAALTSQLRSGLKKCSSFKVKPSFKENKPNEPTEMEKALLRQLEYLQEEKNLDVQELQVKIEQKDAVIDTLEAKLATKEAMIEELQENIGELKRRMNRNSAHHSA